MPKKKTIPEEEVMQPMEELPEQTGPGDEVPVQSEMPPQDGELLEWGLPGEALEGSPAEMDSGQPSAGEEPPMEPAPIRDTAMGEGLPAAEMKPMPPQEPVPMDKTAPDSTPHMNDRQSFFAMDFREMDRGLTAEERQAWNSIYASFRGRSALSGRIIGADPHSMNVRNKETGKVEKRTIECVVGVSLANLQEQWRLVLKDELEAEAEKHDGVRLVITDVAGDSSKQAADVERLMSYDIDLLIISPCDVEALTPVISNVYADVPVIVLDRAVEGYDYSLFIGPDNDLIGRQAGKTVLELLAENEITSGTVLELKNDSYASESRSAEFVRTVSEASVSTRSIDLAAATRDCAEDTLLTDPQVLDDVDVIFAHNDYMAYGAHLVLEKLGIDGIRIVGLDGFSGENGGLQLVEHGVIDATVTCPTGGAEAIQYAVDIINDVSGIPKKIILRSHQIRPDNVSEYQRETVIREAPTVIRVGYAQIGEESHWREACTESIRQAAKDFDIDLTMEFTEPTVKAQTELVRKFIGQDMDVIVISPVVEDGWQEVLKEAQEAGIPILLVDRMVNAEEKLYTSFTGADCEEEGRRCARWLMAEFSGQQQVRVLELRGTEGSSPAQDRKTGFEAAIAGDDRCKIVYSVCGEFTRDGGRSAVRQYLSEHDWDIDAIYAHNDDMALGVIEALAEAGIRPGVDVKIMSINGTADALEALQNGEMNCVVECNPLLGPQLMKAITDLIQGKELPLRIITDEMVFTSDTPRTLFENRKY